MFAVLQSLQFLVEMLMFFTRAQRQLTPVGTEPEPILRGTHSRGKVFMLLLAMD